MPANIVKHSRLVGLQKGALKVAMDSATVRAELDARLRGGLLRTLQVASRGTLYRVQSFVETPIDETR